MAMDALGGIGQLVQPLIAGVIGGVGEGIGRAIGGGIKGFADELREYKEGGEDEEDNDCGDSDNKCGQKNSCQQQNPCQQQTPMGRAMNPQDSINISIGGGGQGGGCQSGGARPLPNLQLAFGGQ